MTALQQPSQLLALHACIEAGALNVLGLPSCIQAVEELLCTNSIPCSSAIVSVSVDDSTASRMLASGTTCVFPSSLESMYFYHGGIDSVENCMHVLDTHLSICMCHNGLEGTAEFLVLLDFCSQSWLAHHTLGPQGERTLACHFQVVAKV